MFAEYLPPNVLQIIASFELQQDPQAIDKIYWNGEPSGKFTIKSALQLIRSDWLDTDHPCWKRTWKMLLPQRIKFFLWLVLRDRLMTNSNRFLRHLTTDPRCRSCGAVEETLEHVLRSFPSAALIWKKFPWIDTHELFGKSFDQWLEFILREQNQTWCDSWAIVFATSPWWIWKWRNNKCFDREQDVPCDQISL